ncbi:MAG: hypothetical protein HKN00_04595 [Flavobacteriaceae bacterium]|nr:hypothetical protein [Bacteroidia bacterium]NNF74441.1 hypothetical protein [Flavobacteriaceae bacterium]NNK73640.1 hypothetical protein [Flavobacteriaceae bacterium]
MVKKIIAFLILSSMSCDTGNLTLIADLPNALAEVSGMECQNDSSEVWMLNDSGNKAKLYRLDRRGTIKHEIKIDAKNHDWEDLTTDNEGNLYIGDFGNNLSKRKNLVILKVNKDDLERFDEVAVERISFKYPNQSKFPPKKKQMYFDSEAFLYFNDSLYIFTKSRVRGNFGRTDLYKVPAKRGQHIATYIDSFTTCEDLDCWITAADISDDGGKVVLLTPKSAWLFTEFKGDNFFSGRIEELPFNHRSQKESLCFKTNNMLYIADERANGSGGNLYEFNLN